MNRVLLRQDEIDPAGCVLLSDRRATHLLDILHVTVGQTVRVGMINGPVGTAVIDTIRDSGVGLRCSFTDDPEPRSRLDILLALPRPKVMKRLWAPLASLGVNRIVITNAAKVERNYFDTHWIDPAQFEPLLIEGLEQAGRTQLPEVKIVRRLKPFIEDDLDALCPPGTRLLAHPSSEQHHPPTKAFHPPALLALGPEGGWTPYETDLFGRHGFSLFSLGPQTLRTDVACIALASVINYLQRTTHEALPEGPS